MSSLILQEKLILEIFSNFQENLKLYKSKNGSIYGLFKALKKKGRKVYEAQNTVIIGLCIIKNECFYIGELSNNKRDGFAYTLFPNGLIFKGFYKNNQKVQGSVYDNGLQNVIYQGEWENDVYNGQGKLVTEEGYTYEGNFQDGLFQGNGKIEWINGDVYIGEFHEHQKSGQGELRYTNGDYYKGEFKEGLFHGRGIYQLNNQEEICGEFFNGNIQNPKKQNQKIQKIFQNFPICKEETVYSSA